MPENNTTPADESLTYNRSTEQFAVLNGIKASSVRAQFYKTGSYFKAIPRKRPNGRLVWPNVSVTVEAA